jgi:NADH dehydrogenase/NADH:ubiquinone oxidoreductase subunit G
VALRPVLAAFASAAGGAAASPLQPGAVKMAVISVNGRPVSAPEGSTLLQAAASAGVHIPTLCNHPRLPYHPGTCRVCLVEVDGKLRPACTTPVEGGMRVATDTAQDSVRGTLALLRAGHPASCKSCNASNMCEFKGLLQRYSAEDSPLGSLPACHRDRPNELYGDLSGSRVHSAIAVDLDKCVKCGRCVTACQEVQQMNVLGWMGRGRDRHPGVVPPGALSASKCIECGQCSVVCPTGSIVERTEWREVSHGWMDVQFHLV